MCRLVCGHAVSDVNGDQLSLLLKKSLSQPTIYDGFSTRDLSTFVNSRNLGRHEHRLGFTIAVDNCLLVLESLERTDQGSDALMSAAECVAVLEKLDQEQQRFTSALLLSRVRRSARMKTSLYHSIMQSSTDWGIATKALRTVELHARTSLVSALEAADRKSCFNFFGLSREVRDMVYDLVCQASLTVYRPHRSRPAIAKTCRQARDKALQVYFAVNRFAVIAAGSGPQNKWLDNMIPEHISSIRSFSFVHTMSCTELTVTIKKHGHYTVDMQSHKSGPVDKHYLRQIAGLHSAEKYDEDLVSWYTNNGMLDILFRKALDSVLHGPLHEIACDITARSQELVQDELDEKLSEGVKTEIRRELSHLFAQYPMEQWMTLRKEWVLAGGFSNKSIEILAKKIVWRV